MEEKHSGYRDLIAWQKGLALAEAIYRVTADFPDAERYGLISQLRRAGVSIPSNIAEGYGRGIKGRFRPLSPYRARLDP